MRRLAGLVAALLLGSAAGAVVVAGPATAASCAQGQGVTVVVNSAVSCDAGAASPAAANFRGTGHSLTMVDRQPGFVCRVDGAPSSAGCVNTPPSDAYWALFWSDGKSGKWVYASQGVGSLKVPAGGWVALVFQSSDARVSPGVTPLGPAPAPKPTAKATKRPASKPAAKPSSRPAAKPASKATPAKPTTTGTTPKPSASASATPKASAATPSASASPGGATAVAPSATPTDHAESTDDTTPTSEAVEQSDDSGSLGWVAGVLAIILLAGMGGLLWRRKAAGGPS